MKKKVEVSLGRDGIVILIPNEMIRRILNPRVTFATVQDFTRRENEVLKGVCRGLANKEIANELSLSERTIKFHVSSLLLKTKSKTRFDLQALFAESSKNGESK